ncbi:MAG: AraC family transcriptional regulator [Saprospiraceae bacterium]|nr:AraC family transcriptional regulator [Saprospiraceae bacterium]
MDQRVAAALEYIKRNYHEKIKLEDIAKATHLSPFHFQRLFSQEIGESPDVYLRRIRLEKAGHLLHVNPDKSLTAIALQCGFRSLPAFSRTFKQVYGMSPTQYRNNTDTLPLVDTQKGTTSPKVEIVYFPATWIYYRHTNVYFSQLYGEFEAAKAEAQAEGMMSARERFLGAYVHIPFHVPRTTLNYFAGVEVDIEKVQDKSVVFCIPEGRYAAFETDDSYENLAATMIRFKNEWLDLHPYQIKDIFAMEELLPASQPHAYPKLNRKIYVPIERTS